MRLLIPLFSPATGTWGGMTRVLAVGKAAREAGHEVAFCASGYLEKSLKERGYPVYPTPVTTFLGLPAPISRILEQRSQKVSPPIKPGRDFGSIWLVLLFSGMARSRYLRELVSAELRACRDFRADFIFTDLDPGAFLLAQITGLPVAATYQTPLEEGTGSLSWNILNRSVRSVQEVYRLPIQTVDRLCHGPQVLKIIPSVQELEGTDPNRKDVCYVGQLLGDIQPSGMFQPEPGKRYVFVYAGTGSVALGRLRSVLPQVFPDGGKSICLVGSQSIQQVERIGAVEFRPFVPAADILPYCGWTICHAGQNTIIQSLMNQVPLLMFPGAIFERRYNARKVQAAEGGRMGEIDQFSVEWLKPALAEPSEFEAGTARLSESIRSQGGAQTAVEAIERWWMNG